MIDYEDNCVCCDRCVECGRKRQLVMYCDRCECVTEELYEYEGEQLCGECLLEVYPKVEA